MGDKPEVFEVNVQESFNDSSITGIDHLLKSALFVFFSKIPLPYILIFIVTLAVKTSYKCVVDEVNPK